MQHIFPLPIWALSAGAVTEFRYMSDPVEPLWVKNCIMCSQWHFLSSNRSEWARWQTKICLSLVCLCLGGIGSEEAPFFICMYEYEQRVYEALWQINPVFTTCVSLGLTDLDECREGTMREQVFRKKRERDLVFSRIPSTCTNVSRKLVGNSPFHVHGLDRMWVNESK